MSKKLIAVAAAAALALTGLVATPANSTVGPFEVTVNGEVGGTGLTAAAAFTINVPSQDVLRTVVTPTATANEAVTVTAVRVEVQTPGSTDVVRLTAGTGAKVMTLDAFTDATTKNTTLGGATAEDAGSVGAEGNASFVVYATSTTATTVTVTSGTNSTVFHIKGLTADANTYHVDAVTIPSSVATGVDADIKVKVLDMFGNVIESSRTTGVTTLGQMTKKFEGISWSTTRKDHTVTVNGSAAGSASIEIKSGATKVDAFGTPRQVFATFTVGGTSAEQVTALTAQITALTAQLAALTASTVTKAKYNALVRKYNRTNPAKKVARVL